MIGSVDAEQSAKICAHQTQYGVIKPWHFTTWMKYCCHVRLFQSGSKCPRVQCDETMGTYGAHLPHCERGVHRIKRHGAQARLLEADLIKAATHPVFEHCPFGLHKERADIRALGSRGGSDMFDTIFCHPLSPARVRDGMEHEMNLLEKV